MNDPCQITHFIRSITNIYIFFKTLEQMVWIGVINVGTWRELQWQKKQVVFQSHDSDIQHCELLRQMSVEKLVFLNLLWWIHLCFLNMIQNGGKWWIFPSVMDEHYVPTTSNSLRGCARLCCELQRFKSNWYHTCYDSWLTSHCVSSSVGASSVLSAS